MSCAKLCHMPPDKSDEVRPVGLIRYTDCRLLQHLYLLNAFRGKVVNDGCNFFCHLRLIVIVAMNHFDPVIQPFRLLCFSAHTPNPDSEVVMVGMEKATLSWGVYPQGS